MAIGKRKREETESGESGSRAIASVLSSSEVAFPRGGAGALTPLEVKEISNEVARDVLFETESSSKRKSDNEPPKKVKRVSKTKKQPVTKEEEEQVQIENFNFKSLIPGTMVLGQISKITKLDLALSLGDNLVGYIPITSISEEISQMIERFEESSDDEEEEVEYKNDSDEEEDEKDQQIKTGTLKTKIQTEFPSLHKIFRVGQWLRAIIVKPTNVDEKKRNKKRIELSVEPKTLNKDLETEDLVIGNLMQASIKSIEDHGIVLNVGREGYNGFVSNKELKNANVSIDELSVGNVLLTTIVSALKGRTITLRPVESSSNSKKNTIQSITSIDALYPGLLVEGLVTSVTKNGVIFRVFGLVDGTANLAQLNVFDLQTLKHKYAIGSKIKTRIVGIYLKNGTKKLMLSVLPHVMNFQSSPFNALEAFPIGHIFESVEVKGNDPNYIYVSVGSTEVFGQVYNSKIEGPIEGYSLGTNHKARVLGYNPIDNVLILTMESKVINTKYLRPEDMPVGELITGEISKVLPEAQGIIVKYGEFDAFVGPNHISDIKLIYPERKFKPDTKVKARVLKIVNGKIMLTLKKSLVNVEDEEILTDFSAVKVGFKTPATVDKFVHNGVIVAFFGNLKAFLPKAEISETFVDRADEHLRLGQTVSVKILSINEKDERFVVTLRQSSNLSDGQKNTMNELIPGKSVVDVIVVEKTKDSVIVELPESSLRGVIFSGQLSDGNIEQNNHLIKKITIGQTISTLVLEKDFKSRIVSLTGKQSLIDASKKSQLPVVFKDIKVNEQVFGYVKNVTNLGIFVSFAGKVTGLVLKKYASDKKIEDLSKSFYKFQSVSCYVTRVDEENKRFLLSLKQKTSEENTEKAINPIDETVETLGQFVPGRVTKAIVKSVKGTQLNVQVADNLEGRVAITNVFNSFKDIKDPKQPLSQFHKNDIINVKVIGFHDAKTHRFLPISHKGGKNVVLELSMLSKDIEGEYAPLTLADTVKGSKWFAFINNIAKGYVWASISESVHGRISFRELTKDVTVLEELDSKLPIGSAIEVTVKSVDTEHNSVQLTAIETPVVSLGDIKENTKYPARVLKVKENFVLVEIAPEVIASCFITDALDDHSKKLNEAFHVNDYVTASVLSVDRESKKIAVSLRDTKDKKIVSSYKDLTRGDIVFGFVKNIADNGVYVALGRDVHALVRISDLSDSYLKDWKKYFTVNQPVIGKISSCKEEGRILMTLKETEVSGDLNHLKKFDDLVIGEFYEGAVRRATDFGVFVQLDGCLNVSGLCHRSEISDNTVDNVVELFGEGDRVKVKVLKIDQAKKQLSLGMKASYFTEESNAADEDVDMKESEDDQEDVEDNDEEADSEDEDLVMEDAEDDEDDSDDDEESTNTPSKGVSTGLSTNGFDWTASILTQAEDDESSDEDEDFTNEKKRKKQKQRKVEDKTGDLNVRAPQSVQDFERLIVGNPNSSIIWMNFMSFQLQLSEVEKAREIGERALKTISYREEQEKLNIWIALLNLENTFGTEETLEDVFSRSCQYMEPLTMHQKLAGIYMISENFESVDVISKKILKKFGSKNVSVWVSYGTYLIENNRADEAQEVLSKSLSVLPKRDHIEVVRKFGQLEFSKGDVEKGRTLFEGLISDAAKRIDLWNVYIDQEIKHGKDEIKVRELFERVFTKKLSRKQAKFFFSKWLVFEEENGDAAKVTAVKAKASEYVKQHKE